MNLLIILGLFWLYLEDLNLVAWYLSLQLLFIIWEGQGRKVNTLASSLEPSQDFVEFLGVTGTYPFPPSLPFARQLPSGQGLERAWEPQTMKIPRDYSWLEMLWLSRLCTYRARALGGWLGV